MIVKRLHVSLCLMECASIFSLIIFIDRPKEPATQAYVCDLMSKAILFFFYLFDSYYSYSQSNTLHTNINTFTHTQTSNSIEYFRKTSSHARTHSYARTVHGARSSARPSIRASEHLRKIKKIIFANRHKRVVGVVSLSILHTFCTSGVIHFGTMTLITLFMCVKANKCSESPISVAVLFAVT